MPLGPIISDKKANSSSLNPWFNFSSSVQSSSCYVQKFSLVTNDRAPKTHAIVRINVVRIVLSRYGGRFSARLYVM
jgi:hypothetical protein